MKKSGNLYTGNYYAIILYRLALAFAVFWISRLIFYLFNPGYFSHLGAGEIAKLMFFGMRFDLSALLMINAPFILMMAIPLPVRNKAWYRWIAGFLFYAANFSGLAVNFSDVIYFRFTQKRMVADIFTYMKQEGGFLNLFPQFLHDFWYMFLIFGVCFALLVWLSRKLKFRARKRLPGSVFMYYLRQVPAFLVTVFFLIVGIRGGFQLKPINIITAGRYTGMQYVPLVLNTPFTIIKTFNRQGLKPVKYFAEKEAEQIYSPVHQYSNIADSIPSIKNVVIIIMESMSSEHTGAFNKHLPDYPGFTPFLDSLMKESLSYNGFANGKQSIEGIPSVVAGIPSLMNRPYIISAYAGNRINTLAGILKQQGYETAFYHGGTNGTMNFDGFAAMAGFGHYYGRTEYHNDDDYDGNWGIFDEPFFQYFAGNLQQTREPFFATIFSLSAHHPYTIPDQHKGSFRKGNLKIQEAVMYADYALKRFFETAESMPWYDSTLFVITADHTSEPYLDEYKTRVGIYRIPIVFYLPGHRLKAPGDIAVSQADIMPSVLYLLKYHQPFVAFGNNIFDEHSRHFAVNYINGIYQIITSEYVLEFDGQKSVALYRYQTDKLLEHNLIDQQPAEVRDMERLLKAYIWQYNHRMIENRLTFN